MMYGRYGIVDWFRAKGVVTEVGIIVVILSNMSIITGLWQRENG